MKSVEVSMHHSKCEENICQTDSICLHTFSDLSHVPPAAFVYLLKECYICGKFLHSIISIKQPTLKILWLLYYHFFFFGMLTACSNYVGMSMDDVYVLYCIHMIKKSSILKFELCKYYFLFFKMPICTWLIWKISWCFFC